MLHQRDPWRVSLHGGHSGQFCDHAEDSLREVLQAAVDFGYHTFGVSEHAPRTMARFLYDEEKNRGWTVETLAQMFQDYQTTLAALAEEFSDRLIVLRGFESEVVPTEDYIRNTQRWRAQMKPDFIVGSVHHVHQLIIDGPPDSFAKAMELCGGLEALAVEYYRLLAQMIQDLQPEVVGHFDLIRKKAGPHGNVDTPTTRKAARLALDAAEAHNCILDLNTAGWSKGLPTAYPAPWLLAEANRRGLGFCFGDDSHGPSTVGRDIERGRDYLLDNGITTITGLTKEDGQVVRRTWSLV